MDKFQLTISGNNFLFSRLVSYDQVKQINALVLQHTPEYDESVSSQASPPVTPQRDVASFIASKNARRTPDKIVVIAYYMWDVIGQNQFQRQDLVEFFKKAMEPIPKNLSRDLRWVEKIGWIAETSQTQGIFYLTQLGKEVVEKNFPADLIKKTTTTKAGLRR